MRSKTSGLSGSPAMNIHSVSGCHSLNASASWGPLNPGMTTSESMRRMGAVRDLPSANASRSGARAQNLEARVRQNAADNIENKRLVVDDQNYFAHSNGGQARTRT